MSSFDQAIVYEKEVSTSTETSAMSPKIESTEFYKKWFKTSTQAGFISLSTWLDAGKVVVDIGKLGGDSKVSSSTKCFVDAFDLITYLHCVVHGTSTELFPKRSQCPSPESFVSFGGSGTISRVFKIHYWGAKTDSDGDPKGFAWKCGHFEGKVSATGAIEPNWSAQKSADMIKVTRLEMHTMYHKLNYALNTFSTKSTLYS